MEGRVEGNESHTSNMLLLFVFLLLLSSSSTSEAGDFCVADLSLPEGPTGYPCKNSSTVTVDDFIFTGFRKPLNTSNNIRAAVTVAFSAQFPGLNGLGISAAFVEVAPGGLVPIHTHPAGSELIVVTQGTIIAGFISSANVAYYKTLEPGDVMVFPQGLLHFQANIGETAARAVVGFSNPNPGVQILPMSLFGNGLPSEIVEKVSFIDEDEVRRLKTMFGGTN